MSTMNTKGFNNSTMQGGQGSDFHRPAFTTSEQCISDIRTCGDDVRDGWAYAAEYNNANGKCMIPAQPGPHKKEVNLFCNSSRMCLMRSEKPPEPPKDSKSTGAPTTTYAIQKDADSGGTPAVNIALNVTPPYVGLVYLIAAGLAVFVITKIVDESE